MQEIMSKIISYEYCPTTFYDSANLPDDSSVCSQLNSAAKLMQGAIMIAILLGYIYN